MSQKDEILTLLKKYGTMTQGQLAEAIYGDKKHMPYIYDSLMRLVNNKIVERKGERPSYYSLLAESLPDEAVVFRQGDINIDLFEAAAKEFYHVLENDSNGRYRSWEHCYKAFHDARKENHPNVDYLSLMLSFYLASWGMYRGSTFLLQKDYRIHIPIVEELLKAKYHSLAGIDCYEYLNNPNLDLLMSLHSVLEEYYEKVRSDVRKDEVVNSVSNTLITKVLLGTMGCVPAYDQYFVIGVKDQKVTTGSFSTTSIRKLALFYEANKERLEAIRSGMKVCDLPYPQMKLLDMGFWQIGKNIASNK